MQFIRERHQAVIQMHRHDLCVLHSDVAVAEIPQSPNAQRDQMLCGILCHFLGKAQNGSHRLLLCSKRLQLFHGLDFQPGHLISHQLRFDVKDSDQTESTLLKTHVFRNDLPQISCADQNRRQQLRQSHDALQIFPQFCHRISVALLSEAAKTAQILSNLRGSHSQTLPQFSGGSVRLTLPFQLLQQPIVPWQPADYRFGNLMLLHHN